MHHAYLLIGGREAGLRYVEGLFGHLTGSPDYFSWEGSLFGIDEARHLSEQAQRKAFLPAQAGGTGKVFFIAPEKITLEAENALLKTFEEPIADTHFFLLLRDIGPVIPTLRSRMQTVRLEGGEIEADAATFLKASLKERMNFVRKFVDKEKNLSSFLDDLLLVVKEKRDTAALRNIYKMRLVSDQRAAASRLVLEHLALVL